MFNHDVDPLTATTLGNYFIPNTTINSAVVMEGALNTVLLTLQPGSTVNSSTRELIINGVKAKNSVANQPSLSTTVQLKENVAPMAIGAVFLSANEIEVTFSENISGLANDTFIVQLGNQNLAITSVAASAGVTNKATITLTDNLTANATVTVKKGAGVGTVVDEAGNKLTDTFMLPATFTVTTPTNP